MENRFGRSVRHSAIALMVAAMGLVGSASATLLDRGPLMVYDTVLDITWTRQGGDGVTRNWAAANAWAASLVFGGFDDWRLPWESVSAQAGPVTSVVACNVATEIACRDNEMGYMFYYNLGGTLLQNKTGTQTALGGQVLTGIQQQYWSGTEFSSGVAWLFQFNNGDRAGDLKGFQLSAWAVRPGDVAAAVPEPGSLLLLGLGALGLGWSRRRGRRR